MALKLCFSAGQTNLLDREDHLSHQATTGLTLEHSVVSNDGENLGSKALSSYLDGFECPADRQWPL